MAELAPAKLSPRQHIQNFTGTSNVVHYWGYADRIVPCVNDAGSCAYLDSVYDAHNVGMVYTAVTWGVIVAILMLWALFRKIFPSAASPSQQLRISPSEAGDDAQGATERKSALLRLRDSAASLSRQWLLPESARWIFGHTTRLQVSVLAIIVIYLTALSFAGMTYNVWVTPVKGYTDLWNVRSTLGPWSDRVGVWAYALTPLSIMFSSRESLISILTGIPYQSFMFMHRWLGYIIFLQSALHTIGWCIIEIRLYQPQPSVGINWIKQLYMIWGVVAMILLTILVVLSTKTAMRAFGYEFFRKAHYVLAMVYIGACIGHWQNLQCFLIPAIAIWGLDRIARLVRTALLHYNYLEDGTLGFASAQAAVKLFPDPDGRGDVVRLDFEHPQQSWDVGHHFFLCFPELNIWQSHPMTPLQPPKKPGAADWRTPAKHAYVMRARAGETKKLAQLAASKLAAATEKTPAAVSVVLSGPYGQSVMEGLRANTNVLCVAGGTGVTFVLPVLLEIVRGDPVAGRRIEFVWAIQHARDMEWVAEELAELRAGAKAHALHMDVFLTRDPKTQAGRTSTAAQEGKTEAGNAPAEEESSSATVASSGSISSGEEVEEADHVALHRPARIEKPEFRRPHMDAVVNRFIAGVAAGSTTVYGSGPLGMIADLRAAVARQNSGAKVWRGEDRFNVRLVSDDRLEW